MKCIKCGFEMPEQAKFCMMCGAKVEKTAPHWADSNVEVTFEGIRANEEYYCFCFRYKNYSGKNIVPILYSLTVCGTGTRIVNDALMQIVGRQDNMDEAMQSKFFSSKELPHGDEALCAMLRLKKDCAIDLTKISKISVSPAYCLRDDGGYYKYGPDQYNLPEQTCEI